MHKFATKYVNRGKNVIRVEIEQITNLIDPLQPSEAKSDDKEHVSSDVVNSESVVSDVTPIVPSKSAKLKFFKALGRKESMQSAIDCVIAV